jgi:hypothetical protein
MLRVMLGGRMRNLIAAVAVMLLASPVMAADYESGNHWLGKCTDAASGADRLECMAFLQGLRAGHSMGHMFGAEQLYCIPPQVTFGQMRLVAEKHLKQNPDALHLPFGLIATRAFRDAFPCAESPPPATVSAPKR